MIKPRPPKTLETRDALASWVSTLDGVPRLAVDTESDSFHHYREKVCLIQVTARGEDVIIDPLAIEDLEPLRPVFEDPNRIKIFHDAGYDLACLGRDFDFAVQGLFDTMLASRLLGIKNFGLAAILKERFGFEANKRMQRSDWARRPLTAEQIDYARFDTHFLPELMDQLTRELELAGRLSWALEDCARLPDQIKKAPSRDPREDPDAFWRVRGVKALSPAARGRAKALYLVREKIAQRLDRPPFKVFGENVLIELARKPPRTLKELGPRPGLRRAGVDRFGNEILAALKKAKPISGKPPSGTGRRKRSGRFLDPKARKRYENLRNLRKRMAGQLGMDPEVTLANATLEGLARTPPRNIQELLTHEQLQGWRRPIFADAIMRVVDPE